MAGKEVSILVKYCDDYIGYTVVEWINEFKEIASQEYGLALKPIPVKDCNIDYDLLVSINNTIVSESLPSDPGYLYELLKRTLDKLVKDRNSSLD